MNLENAEALGFHPDRLAHLGTKIEADLAAGKYHGAALRVGRQGGTAFAEVFGHADKAAGRLLTEHDVFVSMSIGKQFANTIVLQRIERGELALSMQVGEILPAYRSRGLERITLFHLLTHTSGIMGPIPAVDVEVLTNITALTDYIGTVRPDALPGERVNYSIIAAHSVMAEMVRIVDGGKRSYTDIIDQDLFEPLGMTNTSLGPRDDLVKRLCPVVACYEEPGMFAPAEMEAVGAVVTNEGCELPAGGYLTTIEDVDRFTRMLANGGELDDVRILSPVTIDYCTQNFTGDKPNGLFDYARDTRGWEPWPASIGIGFFMRGEGIQPGPMSNFSSPYAFCGWGAGSTCFWIDPDLDIHFSFLSTGLMEETWHIERIQRLSDIAVTALVDD